MLENLLFSLLRKIKKPCVKYVITYKDKLFYASLEGQGYTTSKSKALLFDEKVTADKLLESINYNMRSNHPWYKKDFPWSECEVKPLEIYYL